MERQVSREKRLSPFLIGIGELEALFVRLLELFERPEDVRVSISISRPSERLSFESVDELKQYSSLQGRQKDFWLRLSQNGRSISIRAGRTGFFAYPAEVKAEAETEAWCAGAVETASAFLHTYKTWYSWFVSAPIGWILYAVIFLPGMGLSFFLKDTKIEGPIITAWLMTVSALAFLYVAKGWLLPSSVICITENESIFRRYTPELSLALALLSVILTVIGWFVTKS